MLRRCFSDNPKNVLGCGHASKFPSCTGDPCKAGCHVKGAECVVAECDKPYFKLGNHHVDVPACTGIWYSKTQKKVLQRECMIDNTKDVFSCSHATKFPNCWGNPCKGNCPLHGAECEVVQCDKPYFTLGGYNVEVAACTGVWYQKGQKRVLRQCMTAN